MEASVFNLVYHSLNVEVVVAGLANLLSLLEYVPKVVVIYLCTHERDKRTSWKEYWISCVCVWSISKRQHIPVFCSLKSKTSVPTKVNIRTLLIHNIEFLLDPFHHGLDPVGGPGHGTFGGVIHNEGGQYS